jgi:ribokinase
MSLSRCKNELLDFLQKKTRDCKVVVMPDFFLDRLINLDWDVPQFLELVTGVAKRTGGSIDGVSQTDIKGGNAVNIASALASLGVNVTPIVCTNPHGLQQIKYDFESKSINTSHIKVSEKASITTALEFKEKSGKTNVMLRDLGALANFGPKDLDENDYSLIENSDYTCLFNWAGTLKYGTELAEAVFARAKAGGKHKTFYDSADPHPNIKAIHDLIDKVLKSNNIDILSLNENEAVTYASLLDNSILKKKVVMPFAKLAMEAARVLSKHFSSRIDLHTTEFSATFRGNHEIIVPAFKIKVLRATGAGDAWNAGNLLADHHNLSDESRLMLANAVSASYLSSEDGLHPTKEKLIAFLRANA